jgi:hypothetical protein
VGRHRAAWATSDTLHLAVAMLGSRILRQAADAYDRAARPPYGRIPPPTPAGNQLRQAARLLSAFACLTGDRALAPIVLITRLAGLAEAVAELRESQTHAARPRPPASPPNACTPLPARLRASVRWRSLPGCLSPSHSSKAASQPRPDSPALSTAGCGQHSPGHAAPAGKPRYTLDLRASAGSP